MHLPCPPPYSRNSRNRESPRLLVCPHLCMEASMVAQELVTFSTVWTSYYELVQRKDPSGVLNPPI